MRCPGDKNPAFAKRCLRLRACRGAGPGSRNRDRPFAPRLWGGGSLSRGRPQSATEGDVEIAGVSQGLEREGIAADQINFRYATACPASKFCKSRASRRLAISSPAKKIRHPYMGAHKAVAQWYIIGSKVRPTRPPERVPSSCAPDLTRPRAQPLRQPLQH
jgi:hypothetical protein